MDRVEQYKAGSRERLLNFFKEKIKIMVMRLLIMDLLVLL